jgi:hypothetical protein
VGSPCQQQFGHERTIPLEGFPRHCSLVQVGSSLQQKHSSADSREWNRAVAERTQGHTDGMSLHSLVGRQPRHSDRANRLGIARDSRMLEVLREPPHDAEESDTVRRARLSSARVSRFLQGLASAGLPAAQFRQVVQSCQLRMPIGDLLQFP